MIHAFDDNPAALLFGQRQIGLGQGRCLDLAVHQRLEPRGGPVGGPAGLDQVARQEPFEHLVCQIMGAEIIRHGDHFSGQLLRRIHVGLGRDHDTGPHHDRAAAKLAAFCLGILHTAVIAPFAGVVHVRAALFEGFAVARECG